MSVVLHALVALAFAGQPPRDSRSPVADEEVVWLEATAGPLSGATSQSAMGAGAERGVSATAGERGPAPALRAGHPLRERTHPSRSRAPSTAIAPLANGAPPTLDRTLDTLMAAATGAASGGPDALSDWGNGATHRSGDAPGTHGAGGALGTEDGQGAAPAQGPRLLAAGNPCAGYFPTGAHVAHGSVQVEVEVSENGRIAATRVVAEQPTREGFGGAARACVSRLRFSPAQSSRGTAIAGRARLQLSFDRS